MDPCVDADIRLVNDQVPSAEVHLTTQHNVLANVQRYTNQSEPSYDTYLLEKVDSNTIPDSTNMCHMGGEIDQNVKHDQVKSPLLKAEFLKTNDMVEKEVYNELSNRFLQLEKHCILLEISMQQKEESFQSNKPCKNQESPKFREFFEINDLKAQLQAKTTLIYNLKNQIKSVKEASNEPKVKHDIDVLKIINIELESSVAKLLAENEKINKENKHLTQTYKDLYDSIKKTRIQMKDHNDSLIAQVNSKTVEKADLKAQIQEKVFANVALKNELRKLKGNSVDTKNSQEEPYGSSVMAHNHYLEEARKKTQERNRNSRPSVMHTTSLQNTANGSKPNPRSNNQISRSLPVSKSSCGMSNGVSLVDHSRNSSSFSDSKHFVCSTCHKYVFNANHDNCITKFLKEVDSRAKVQSPKTRNKNKPVKPKSHTQKPGRQIVIGQRFSPKKSSVVHEKPNTPRSCLRWIPTRKMFTDNTTKVDSEPPNGSNGDMTNPYECDQALNVSAGTTNSSAGTSCNLIKERLKVWLPKRLISHKPVASLFNDKMTSVHISSSLALQRHMASAGNTSGPVPQSKERCTLQCALSLEEDKSSWLVPNPAPPIPYVPPTNKELELLFQPMFDEYFTPPGDRQVPTINAVQVLVNLTGPLISISCDQDAPSGSHLTSSSDHQSSLVHHGVAVEQSFEVNPFSAADPEPFVNVFAPDSNSEASSSGAITTTKPNQSTQPHEHL
ncbi:hypothetical protein Tco_0164238 [Tanacetum coccineum]